jgi:signal peptidase I
LTASRLGQLWRNEYFQTAVLIVLIVVVVFGFWFGLRFALGTDYPMLAVASGSMSTVQPDDGWLYPFTPTLHTGDLIIVQAVSQQEIYAAPFNQSGRSGDILVFHLSPNSDELIVHRAIRWYDNTTVITQGDGNSGPGPPFDPEGGQNGKVPVDLVIGKVVLRIPWIGHLALLMRDNSGVYVILAMIIIIIAVELALSILGNKNTKTDKSMPSDDVPET